MSSEAELRDGRVHVGEREVEIWEAGPPGAPGILVHHGTPSSGMLYDAWVQDALSRGGRIVSFSRAGYGNSDPHPGRRVVDVATDAVAVLDALGIERCVTWGVSGGGPHALACAAAAPERFCAVATLGSVAPFDAEGLNYLRGMGQDNWIEFGQALAGRDVLEPALAEQAEQLRTGSPEEMAAVMSTLVDEVDRAVFDTPLGAFFAGEYGETFTAHGAAGWIDDDLAFVAPFGFAVEDVRVPALLVHGDHDLFVPPAHSRWLAERLPGAEAWLLPEEGHLSLLAPEMIARVHSWLLERV